MAVGTAVVLVLTVNPRTPFVSDLNLRLQDRLLRETTREPLPADFLLVALDDASLSLDALEPEEIAESRALQLMREGFPWSREVYALAGRKLLEAGAKLVIFDMVYPGPKEGDEKFAELLREHPDRFVLGAQFDGETYRKPTAVLAAAAGDGVGFASLPERNEIRHVLPYSTISGFRGEVPWEGETVEPALTTVAASRLGKPFPSEITKPLRFRYSKPREVPTISLQELFVPGYWKSRSRNWDIFRDRVVLIGATAEGLKDYHLTPFRRLSGPEIQLHILAAMLRDGWLKSSGPWVAVASILAAAVGVLLLATLRRSPLWFLLWLVTGALFWGLTCLVALVFFSWFLPAAPPLVTWLVCGFLVLACDATLERRERARLRGALERYVSKDMVKELVDNPASYLQTLGGQRKEIVTMFSDLQGFTADSETMDPGEMVALLNEYFGDMVAVVFQKRGTLDKFMGDALMATWGALESGGPREDARHAVRAAFEMRTRLAAINSRRGGGTPWQAGIGITQGPVVFGNIGCQEKMDLTAIGDTVNLAARIEGLTRIYVCDILVDGRMAESLRGECQLLLVDVVRVKGRQKSESLYFPYPGNEPDPWADAFEEAREKYREGKFEEAAGAFDELSRAGLAPGVSALFRQRCEDFQANPPPPDWSGVWDFATK